MAKQILDYRPRFYLTEEESDIILRNADTDTIRKHHGCETYNPARKKLNFEIKSPGIPAPVNNKSIVVRVDENLERRGIVNTTLTGSRSRKTMAFFHFSGSPDRIRRMAFGNQNVDYAIDAPCDNLTKNRLFITWAQRLYRFLCLRYGKENVVAMIAHLDVAMPNVEAVVLAIDRSNRISYNAQFAGANKFEYRDRTISTHDELYKQVNNEFGLERGERKSVREGHFYKMTPEMIEILEKIKNDNQAELDKKNVQLYELNDSVFTAEKRLKSLSTMLSNLEEKRTAVLEETATNVRLSNEEMVERKRVLEDAIKSLDDKILERNAQIEDAKEKVKEAKSRRDEAQTEYEALLKSKKKNDLVRLQEHTLQDMTSTSLACLKDELAQWEEFADGLKLNRDNREILQAIIGKAQDRLRKL